MGIEADREDMSDPSDEVLFKKLLKLATARKYDVRRKRCQEPFRTFSWTKTVPDTVSVSPDQVRANPRTT